LVLSSALESDHYDIGFACDPRCDWLLGNFRGHYFPLSSRSSESFLDALARGKPVYDEDTLNRYVSADLKLFDEFHPDLVVGDFRLSLSISARLRQIPYIAISNCYWSPYWRPPRYVVPSLRPLTTIFPIPIADVLFQVGRPIAFALHSRPLNRVRQKHGLPSLGTDLRRIYTDADIVLYADIAELFPGTKLPPNHHFIGPLAWSPPVSHPDWWDKLPQERAIVYLTLGSSGQGELLPAMLRSLGALDITVIAATAGGKPPDDLPPNAYVAQYLPGDEAAARAKLVICNGGSPTSQQALTAGVPVIGIAGNLDQFLNMATLARAGAGEVMRADRFCSPALARLVVETLRGTTHTKAAQQVAKCIEGYDARSRFSAIVRSAIKT